MITYSFIVFWPRIQWYALDSGTRRNVGSRTKRTTTRSRSKPPLRGTRRAWGPSPAKRTIDKGKTRRDRKNKSLSVRQRTSNRTSKTTSKRARVF